MDDRGSETPAYPRKLVSSFSQTTQNSCDKRVRWDDIEDGDACANEELQAEPSFEEEHQIEFSKNRSGKARRTKITKVEQHSKSIMKDTDIIVEEEGRIAEVENQNSRRHKSDRNHDQVRDLCKEGSRSSTNTLGKRLLYDDFLEIDDSAIKKPRKRGRESSSIGDQDEDRKRRTSGKRSDGGSSSSRDTHKMPVSRSREIHLNRSPIKSGRSSLSKRKTTTALQKNHRDEISSTKKDQHEKNRNNGRSIGKGPKNDKDERHSSVGTNARGRANRDSRREKPSDDIRDEISLEKASSPSRHRKNRSLSNSGDKGASTREGGKRHSIDDDAASLKSAASSRSKTGKKRYSNNSRGRSTREGEKRYGIDDDASLKSTTSSRSKTEKKRSIRSSRSRSTGEGEKLRDIDDDASLKSTASSRSKTEKKRNSGNISRSRRNNGEEGEKRRDSGDALIKSTTSSRKKTETKGSSNGNRSKSSRKEGEKLHDVDDASLKSNTSSRSKTEKKRSSSNGSRIRSDKGKREKRLGVGDALLKSTASARSKTEKKRRSSSSSNSSRSRSSSDRKEGEKRCAADDASLKSTTSSRSKTEKKRSSSNSSRYKCSGDEGTEDQCREKRRDNDSASLKSISSKSDSEKKRRSSCGKLDNCKNVLIKKNVSMNNKTRSKSRSSSNSVGSKKETREKRHNTSVCDEAPFQNHSSSKDSIGRAKIRNTGESADRGSRGTEKETRKKKKIDDLDNSSLSTIRSSKSGSNRKLSCKEPREKKRGSAQEEENVKTHKATSVRKDSHESGHKKLSNSRKKSSARTDISEASKLKNEIHRSGTNKKRALDENSSSSFSKSTTAAHSRRRKKRSMEGSVRKSTTMTMADDSEFSF